MISGSGVAVPLAGGWEDGVIGRAVIDLLSNMSCRLYVPCVQVRGGPTCLCFCGMLSSAAVHDRGQPIRALRLDLCISAFAAQARLLLRGRLVFWYCFCHGVEGDVFESLACSCGFMSFLASWS